MDYLAAIIGGSLPLGLLIFVGSYFGIWRKNPIKLPRLEAFSIFLGAWILAAILIIIFRILLNDQDPEIQQLVGTLWGPLVIGVIIGRKVTAWRRKRQQPQGN